MAHNFKIIKQQNKEGLRLELSGDFDGSSASELINLLNTDLENTARVSIDNGSVHCFTYRTTPEPNTFFPASL